VPLGDGQGSHLLKIRVANTAGLEALLAEIQSWPGVQWTTTSIVLSTLKETTDGATWRRFAAGAAGGRSRGTGIWARPISAHP
jgi:hypothetical protein